MVSNNLNIKDGIKNAPTIFKKKMHNILFSPKEIKVNGRPYRIFVCKAVYLSYTVIIPLAHEPIPC